MIQPCLTRCAKASLFIVSLVASGVALSQSTPPAAKPTAPAAAPAQPATVPAPTTSPAAAPQGAGAATTLPVLPSASAAMPLASDAPVKPKKRRVVRHAPAQPCEAVSDPWDNICKIRKNAEVACSDLSAPVTKTKAGRKNRKAIQQQATPARNLRQECFDAYMRNV